MFCFSFAFAVVVVGSARVLVNVMRADAAASLLYSFCRSCYSSSSSSVSADDADNDESDELLLLLLEKNRVHCVWEGESRHSRVRCLAGCRN